VCTGKLAIIEYFAIGGFAAIKFVGIIRSTPFFFVAYLCRKLRSAEAGKQKKEGEACSNDFHKNLFEGLTSGIFRYAFQNQSKDAKFLDAVLLFIKKMPFLKRKSTAFIKKVAKGARKNRILKVQYQYVQKRCKK